MCLFCFSTEKLTQNDMQGKYGGAYGPFIDNDQTFDVSLCKAPCKAPCCWAGSMLCLCPVSIYMRHKVLNYVDPGSGWSNYSCCQGYFGGCCCIQPGQMGEKSCPVPCMCLEACLCLGPAVSATSNVVRERHSLGLDEDDVRLIRCSNCLFYLKFIFSCVSMMTDCEGDDALASIVNCISDVVFCCVSGCMTAQVNHEMKLRSDGSAPQQPLMQR